MRNDHDWTERTEDGERREVRAIKFGGEWRMQSKIRGDAEWTQHPSPAVVDLEKLRDILFRKYQRRRVPYEDVVKLDAMLEEARADPARQIQGAEPASDEE